MNIPFRRRPRPVPPPVPTAAPTPSEADLFASLDLCITRRVVAHLKPSPRNARTHSEAQIHKLMRSVLRFGFVNPLLIDENGEVIVGHGRLEAAKRLGMKHVPTIVLSHMSDAEKRAYRIADNYLALQAGWDEELRQIETAELVVLDYGLVEDIGFETAEIEIILDGPPEKKPKADPADALPQTAGAVVVTRLGDVWDLGTHRIACGSALEAIVHEILLGNRLAQMVFTDPPYNVKVDGHVGGLGKVRHREFAMASGEMSRAEFVAFLKTAFERIAEVAEDGAIIFTCIDWAHLHEMLEAGHAVFDALKNIVCWSKTNGGMGSFYRSQHELIPVWKKGKAPHVNNIELGAHGRYRTNVWTYAGANTFRRGRMEDLASHPTVKPCALVMDAIKDCSKPGGLVLDPFGGSGTTLIAAEKTRRHARLIELDPAYVDLTIRRWEKLTGRPAVHAETGKTFAETATERAASASPATTTTETKETSDDE